MAKKCAPGLLRLLMAPRALRGGGGSIFWGGDSAPRAPRPAPRAPHSPGRADPHSSPGRPDERTWQTSAISPPAHTSVSPTRAHVEGKRREKNVHIHPLQTRRQKLLQSSRPTPPRMIPPGHHCKRRSLGEKLTVTVRARFGPPWLQNDPICTFSYALNTAVLLDKTKNNLNVQSWTEILRTCTF